jgi:ABC-type glycerol-3-phosphate transport system permease component
VYGLAFTTLFFRNYYVSVPLELVQAARIDGAGFFLIYRRIILPLSLPIFMVCFIWQFTQIWNDFLLPSVVLIETDQKTLPLKTFVFYGKYTSDYGLAMAGLLLSIIPILIFYFVMQRKIISGISAGAVK